MLRRLKNLWSWSNVDPYTLGQQAGKSMTETLIELFAEQRSEIVYPNKVTDVLRDNPEASLDDLITR